MHTRLVRSAFIAVALAGATVLAVPLTAVAQPSSNMTVTMNGATQPTTTPTPTPTNVVTYTCPHQVRGAFCEVNWTDAHGYVTATFYYGMNGMPQVQSFQIFCSGTTCTLEGEAQAANIRPGKWTVRGHTVALIADTDGDA